MKFKYLAVIVFVTVFTIIVLYIQCVAKNCSNTNEIIDSTNNNHVLLGNEGTMDVPEYFDEFLLKKIGNPDKPSSIHIIQNDNLISVWDTLYNGLKFRYAKRGNYWVNYISRQCFERVLTNYSCSPSPIIKHYSRYISKDSIFELEQIFFKEKLFAMNVYIKTPYNNKCIFNVASVAGVDTLGFMKRILAESDDIPHENANVYHGKVYAYRSGSYILCYPALSRSNIWPGVSQDKHIIDNRIEQDGTVLSPDVMPKYPGGEHMLFNDLKLNLILNRYASSDDRPIFRLLITTSGNILDARVYRSQNSDIIREVVMKNAKAVKKFTVANNRGEPVATWYTFTTKYDQTKMRWTERLPLSGNQ